MVTTRQLHEGINEAWGAVVDGWRRLYRRAAGAMTRFTPSGERAGSADAALALRNAGWGLLAAEVSDAGDRIVVRLEAPGMDKKDFELQVVDDALFIRGEKRMEQERVEGRYHVTECAYGSFERVIPLPDLVDDGRAEAAYRNGVLRIELPKSVARQPRVIAVHGG